GDRVRHELRHRTDERLWKDSVAETPSGHREGLAEAIEKDRPLGHALLACDRTMLAVVDQLAIDLVGEHPEVALARDPCDLADRAQVRGDRLSKLDHPSGRRVVRLPALECGHAGGNDRGRRVEIGLADLEVNDVATLRLERARFGEDLERGLRPEARHPWGQR